MKRLFTVITLAMCVAFGCFGQFKTKTYPIYNLKGEFVAYTEIGEQIPDSIPRGVYVVNGYKVPHIPKEHLSDEVKKAKAEIEESVWFECELPDEILDSIANTKPIRDLNFYDLKGNPQSPTKDGMFKSNGKTYYIHNGFMYDLNDCVKVVNGRVIYSK